MDRLTKQMATTLLMGCMALPVGSVETLNETDMGAVHVQSGNVLNVVGPTAAGGDNQVAIQRTSGTESSLSLALNLRGSESIRRQEEVNEREGASIVSLIFPDLTPDIAFVREVPSPDGDGVTTSTVLPGERNVASTVEIIEGRPALRLNIETRVEEIRFKDIEFANSVSFGEGNVSIMRGLEFSARGLLRQNFNGN